MIELAAAIKRENYHYQHNSRLLRKLLLRFGKPINFSIYLLVCTVSGFPKFFRYSEVIITGIWAIFCVVDILQIPFQRAIVHLLDLSLYIAI